MDQHLPIVDKKFRNIVRVIYYMLRKGIIISKPKILSELNSILKRGKIAGKAAIHSLMAFHHHHHHHPAAAARFSIPGAATPSNEHEFFSPELSFQLPFALKTPVVRQLRITDSPFPLRDDDDEGRRRVDAAAEEFIARFYKDLRGQDEMGCPGLS